MLSAFPGLSRDEELLGPDEAPFWPLFFFGPRLTADDEEGAGKEIEGISFPFAFAV